MCPFDATKCMQHYRKSNHATNDLGVHWGEPKWAHIDRENSPACRIMVCQYLCIIYPVFVAPQFPRSVYALKCSMHSGILMCSRARFTTCKEDWSLPWKLSMKTNAHTHGINGFSKLRYWQWGCSCLATCQCTCVTQKRLMGCQTAVLWRSYRRDTAVPACYLQM